MVPLSVVPKPFRSFLLRKLRGSAATAGLEGTVSWAADWVAMSISALVLDRSEWAAWLNPQSAEEGLLKPSPPGSSKVEKVERARNAGSAVKCSREILSGGACRRHGLSVLSCHHVDRGHDFLRRRLMNHVSCSGNTPQRAVRNVPVQMGRLLAFDKPIVRTRNNCDRDLQQPILFP